MGSSRDLERALKSESLGGPEPPRGLRRLFLLRTQNAMYVRRPSGWRRATERLCIGNVDELSSSMSRFPARAPVMHSASLREEPIQEGLREMSTGSLQERSAATCCSFLNEDSQHSLTSGASTDPPRRTTSIGQSLKRIIGQSGNSAGEADGQCTPSAVAAVARCAQSGQATFPPSSVRVSSVRSSHGCRRIPGSRHRVKRASAPAVSSSYAESYNERMVYLPKGSASEEEIPRSLSKRQREVAAAQAHGSPQFRWLQKMEIGAGRERSSRSNLSDDLYPTREREM